MIFELLNHVLQHIYLSRKKNAGGI